MSKYLLCLLILLQVGTTEAQSYNNEWIDYSSTYYKFKIGNTGLYRINQSLLAANGLGSTPAEHFQLWRNGVQIPIYTTVANGVLPANGYIEFWGERNDGIADFPMYKNPTYQFSKDISLISDTASFYLRVNTSGSNARLTNATNDVASNTLPAEPYFIYNYRNAFQEFQNRGKPVYFGGVNVYSSTYDLGEFWSTKEIYRTNPYTFSSDNLYPVSGSTGTLQASFAGNSIRGSGRTVKVTINGSEVINQPLGIFDAKIFTSSAIAAAIFSGTTVNFQLINNSTADEDRVVSGFVDLSYQRQFNFGGSTNFKFNLPATGVGYYLEITNFSTGTASPVLYDLTNGRKLTANTAVAGKFRFVLPASTVGRSLVMVSEDETNIYTVTSFKSRNFINYANTSLQGDYLIVTNKILMGGNNPIEAYKAYRNSLVGGSHTAQIYDIEELEDQFAFGIKRHPLSVKNFLAYARKNFTIKPNFVFLMGKAVTYDEYRLNQNSVYADRLNLVPTFGWPASDNLIASANNEPQPATYVGRLAAVVPEEVEIYLNKIKAFEQQQQNTVQTIANKAWMKTNVHVTGANDPGLDFSLTASLNNYGNIIKDTLFGGNVFSFNKTTTGTATPITDALMTSLFEDGISILNYFGHSSATVLDYNLNSPYDYNNQGKYPLFIVNGCNAGNIYSHDTSRLFLISSLSENFVLAKDRGAIGFIASTHFGVQSYLDAYNKGFYQSLSNDDYNKPVSYSIKDAINVLLSARLDSTTRYLHAEETCLHGDPALKINAHEKPDFVIEEPQVIINPTFISLADTKFDIKVYFHNIGKATGDKVNALIIRQYPDGSMDTLYNEQIKSIRFKDSVQLSVPIVASRDKGENRLIVTIDSKQDYDELSELNNTISKQFFIIEDELRPVYPYNFAIVNKPSIQLQASTANPFSAARDYVMEMDTTELFNSSFKVSQTINSVGGILSFNPSVSFVDSTVYYWRVAPAAASENIRWNTSSFVYLAGSSAGFNQSHLYQHLKSGVERIYIDSNNRNWHFKQVLNSLGIVHSIFLYSGVEDQDFKVSINGLTTTSGACLGKSVIYNVFDPITLNPYYNQANPSTNGFGTYGGFLGSAAYCGGTGREYNFEFGFWDTTGRRKMRDFMDWIPSGALVTARILIDEPISETPYAPVWQNDASIYGAGNTWYDRLKSAGFADVDSFYFPRTWVFNYKKNQAATYTPEWQYSAGLFDRIFYQRTLTGADTLGYITSPVFGMAKAWKQVQWRAQNTLNTSGDNPTLEIFGIDASQNAVSLFTLNSNQQNFDISSIDAEQYPYIQLRMRNADSINQTPSQLRWWRVLYDAVPEGALAPNLFLSFNDSLDLGQPQNFGIAFKNISDVPFTDSMLVKMQVIDASNITTTYPIANLKQLNPGDTAIIRYDIPTGSSEGTNNIFLDVNPDIAQPEQYHFNNFLYQQFKVSADKFRPIMDVTFDGVHILNNDIVSAQPHIQMRLKDNSTFQLLDDTTLMNVRLQYPDGSIRRYYFVNDTLQFTPATGNGENIATVDFYPLLTDDGSYQLLVSGKDKSDNPAGIVEYTVNFNVYNKPMISNLFNYPNPFTTSTAFVFTVTGSEVPQNIRIQILTITGKIVKEITSAELGPIHIGRNITEYKWDGTDQYGQKLGNGVYLYRVITNLNGKSLDKFQTVDKDGFDVNTDKYFNKGYGKMYLMR